MGFKVFFSLSILFHFVYNFLEGWHRPSSFIYLLEFIVAKFHNRWLQSSVVTTILFLFNTSTASVISMFVTYYMEFQ